MIGQKGRTRQGGKFRREREESTVLFRWGTRMVVQNFRRGEAGEKSWGVG